MTTQLNHPKTVAAFNEADDHERFLLLDSIRDDQDNLLATIRNSDGSLSILSYFQGSLSAQLNQPAQYNTTGEFWSDVMQDLWSNAMKAAKTNISDGDAHLRESFETGPEKIYYVEK